MIKKKKATKAASAVGTKKAVPPKKSRVARKAAPPKKVKEPDGPLDIVRKYAACFTAARTPAVVQLPPLSSISLEGRGAPESREFQDAIGALYGTAYTLKFTLKAAGSDFKVPPLEALWWSDYDVGRLADSRGLLRVPRHLWRWKVLLVLPEQVTFEDVRAARQTLSDKRGGDPLPLRVRLEPIDEGKCVQALHVGPYADEPATIRKMHELIREQGLTPCGFHHEIYLGDPRRGDPAKLRTILRQPVR
jgi:hypothetical protein